MLRRDFGKLVGLLAVSQEMAFAQASKVDAPAGAVMINANENPMGPCKEALDSLHSIAAQGGRYLSAKARRRRDSRRSGRAGDRSRSDLSGIERAAASDGVGVLFSSEGAGDGGSGYEAGASAAQVVGAPVVRVRLTKSYSHDVKAMAAVPNAGVIYITNPDNPTGTATPKADIEWLMANKPRGQL